MIHADARPELLAVLRIAVYGMWFGILVGLDTALLADLPPELVELHVLTAPLRFVVATPWLLVTLKVVTLAGCAAAVLGVRPHTAVSGVAAIGILLLDGLMKGVGSYTNHAQLVILLLALLLPFFPAADTLSIHRSRRETRSPWLYRAPLMAAATITALSYAFIGARRLFVGGVSVYTDESMLRWVVARTLEEGAHEISWGLTVLDHMGVVTLLSLGMLVTTTFEILSPVALVRPRFRWMWLVVVAGFHVGTLVTMNIFFWENLILLAVLFTPIVDRVVRRASPAREPATSGVSP